MDKLVFRAPTSRKPRIAVGNPVIRLTAEAYNGVEEISAKTGLTKSYIASQMILFALENTEIAYERRIEDDTCSTGE